MHIIDIVPYLITGVASIATLVFTLQTRHYNKQTQYYNEQTRRTLEAQQNARIEQLKNIQQ